MSTPRLSIVILCYRSNTSIIPFAEEVKHLGLQLTQSLEIILVGNYIPGTSDQTHLIVQELAKNDSTFKAICKPKEGMMGWDMKTGLQRASGDFICIIDGDSQFPINAITTCYKHITTGKYGLVKTYRNKREDGVYRRLISNSYNLLFQVLFPGVNSKDINSKPKMLTREVLDNMKLTSDDWFIDAEIMLNIHKNKVNFFEFPTVFRELKDRPSFVKISAIFEFIKNLLIFKIRRL
jgi:glycosyltransferase involved in cell wall biosynthesis